MYRRAAVIASALIAEYGCATIMHGTCQEVSISSTPTAAQVSVDGESKGKTPLALDLKRKERHLVRVEMDGYLAFEGYLTKELSGWVVGNLVFGGLPGLIIDALTGGLHNLKPREVNAQLSPALGEPSPAAGAAGRFDAPVLAPPLSREPQSAPSPKSQDRTAKVYPSRLRIVTDPLDADVYVGGSRLGRTGTSGLLIELPSGSATLRIEKAGYTPAVRSLVIEGPPSAGDPPVIVIRLSPAVPNQERK